MLHGSTIKDDSIDYASLKKTKLGIWMFIFYSLFYAGFITIAVFYYELMSKIVFAGLNLAIVYGFSLIVVAIIMGLIYNYYCTKFENKLNKEVK